MSTKDVKLLIIGDIDSGKTIAMHKALMDMHPTMITVSCNPQRESEIFKKFAGVCYDEAAIIPFKVLDSLTEKTCPICKQLKKQKKKQNIEPKTQKEIWCNKWNKKLKRKL